MSATRPATKAELKLYALRRLGYPAIDINVCDEQLDDLIEEGIDYYQEYHFNGSYDAFMRVEVTDAIKTAAQEWDQEGSTVWYKQKNYISTNKTYKITKSNFCLPSLSLPVSVTKYVSPKFIAN